MPDLDLDSLAAVAEAATPGQWRAAEQTHGEWYGIQSEHLALGNAFTPTDAAHIAAFDPPTVLALLAQAREARRLRREVAALADEWQVEADAGRDSGSGHPLLVQTYANHATDLRALIGGER